MRNNDESFATGSYEEKLKMLSVMSDAERERAAEQVLYICQNYCGKCPTREAAQEEKLAFCTLGRSEKVVEKKGCLCKDCPLTRTMSLRWNYYCFQGSALDLSEAERDILK